MKQFWLAVHGLFKLYLDCVEKNLFLFKFNDFVLEINLAFIDLYLTNIFQSLANQKTRRGFMLDFAFAYLDS